MMKHYVIIGNGVAAAACIEGIRSIDINGRITIVSEENHPVYCRPLISYYLEGKTDLKRMNYRSEDFYEKNGCEVLYGRKAVSIDRSAKTIELDNGEKIGYDSVCIATGSSPFVPPFSGLETVENKFSFMTIDDTLALESAVDENSDVLIIGAGLIGLKCAEGIKDKVKSVTVCDLAPRVLSSILDDECAGMMQKHLELNDIKFMLGDTAERFENNKAFMKSGAEVSFDVLVLAVGVRANTSLVKNAGGEVNRGIIVNNSMETSIEDIYAAGDCTEGEDISFGQKRVLALLPNAVMQGKCVGANMAGGSSTFDNAIPMNSIGFFGKHAMTAGSYFSEADGGTCYEEKTESSLKRLFVKDGLLTGFILIDVSEQAGIYTALIREKTPLFEVNFDKLRKHTDNTAFSVDVRVKKFGGAV